MEIKSVRIKVKGYVQGVGFRWFVRDSARALGLAGYVRNVSDGSVEILAAGETGKISELIKGLYSGPGSVSAVETSGTTSSVPPGFEIKF